MLRLLVLIAVLFFAPAAVAAPVAVVELRGAISPASSAYFTHALDEANSRGAALLVLKLDTPGGLDTAMRDMIRAILASPVPVATFVAPSGARAASAGTYILYASHVAAMAPGTNLGAATPVPVGLVPNEPGKAPVAGKKADGDDKEGPPAVGDAMRTKAIQDAAAYIRSLAQLRGRNAEWAERAVLRGESLSAKEALAHGVIDLNAADLPDLLRQLDGRTLRLGDSEKKLALAGAVPYTVQPDWKSRLLAVIADPNMALILMMIGIYGMVFEFYSPGLAFPGVIGAICLLLGAYGLQLLPIDYVGVLLILLGAAFMVAEAFFPSFGTLGVGGVVAFVAGALMLVEGEIPGISISWLVLAPLALLSAGLLFAIGALAVRARQRPPAAGAERMLGETAEALEDFEQNGWVGVEGERWWASCRAPLKRGAKVRIIGIDGLTLKVAPVSAGKGGQ